MASTVINTREDLDAITGTIEHDVFMATLRGTLWRLEKDDQAGVWLAIEDNSTIERFGFTGETSARQRSEALYALEGCRVV